MSGSHHMCFFWLTYFRSKEHSNDDGGWPNPLSGIRDAPTPLIGAMKKATKNACGYCLTDNPLESRFECQPQDLCKQIDG